MIWLPKGVLNRFSKDHPSWQERYDRRLRLLKYAGFRFFTPEDWALVGPVPPEIMRSVSAFPYGSAAASGGGGGNTLALTTLSASDTDDVSASAGIRFMTDGNIEEQNNGIWADQNPSTEWIDSLIGESSSDYEAKYDHVTGTAPAHTGFSGENTYTTISATLTWSLTQFLSGTKTSTGSAWVREIADTGNFASANYSIFVSVTGDGCPLCCFTPDTPILMADGSLVPIADVEVGDIIRVRDGIEQVTGIITRTQRPMFMVEFHDGTSLHMSDDHPIYVLGSGYSAINPTVPYKDLGMARKLEVGDVVLTSEGKLTRVEVISPRDYPHTVYTLDNSQFYAGGKLVY